MHFPEDKYLNTLQELVSLVMQVETLLASRGIQMKANASCSLTSDPQAQLTNFYLYKKVNRAQLELDYTLQILPEDTDSSLTVTLYYAEGWGMQLAFKRIYGEEKDVILFFFVDHEDPTEDERIWRNYCERESRVMQDTFNYKNNDTVSLGVAFALIADMADIFLNYPING